MDNHSDSSTSVTDEEEDDNSRQKNETTTVESMLKMSPKMYTEGTDDPIMEDQSSPPLSKQQFEEDKKAVYKHPLFPLLALLLEKCESATSTLNTSSISGPSFNAEIMAFVEHQQRDGKPFLSDNPEVDSLMIKAIQVLRIHLLELEKVSDLCKDFCQRYITCLRTKMSSENLLRGTSSVGANSDNNSNSANSLFDGSSCSSDAESDDFPISSSQTTFPSNSTPQTVYQMVQTAQGLVAQPIHLNSTQQISGSTPITQIGTNISHNNTNNNKNLIHKSHHVSRDSDNDDEMSDDLDSNHSTGSKKKQQKRGVLPKQATSIMRSWLFQHIVHPYPTEDEKRTIASQTNLTLLQVNNWFINARRRILQPMLDTANTLGDNQSVPNQSTSKSVTKSSTPKKLKTSNSMQRFWPQSIANSIQGLSQSESSK
ncbi:homeobox protein PKNOX1-like [Oppia nitens]|uniref:homeobox protein PKNOX1-like n=1 Tax=Oppia nitens TaxID=1686743 RepID=UPI0023DAA9DA|nr:homeobox protein PKNOX1-like [Oppia nitens]